MAIMLEDLPPIPRNIWRRFGPMYGERRERMQATIEPESGYTTIVTCVERPERGTVWIEFCKLAEGGGIGEIVSADVPEPLAEELGVWLGKGDGDPKVYELLDGAGQTVAVYSNREAAEAHVNAGTSSRGMGQWLDIQERIVHDEYVPKRIGRALVDWRD